ELITIETLPNLTAVFHDNGHRNMRVKYLGGFHVLIELDPRAWSSIEGLPPQARHEAALSQIAGNWGEIVLPKKCNPIQKNAKTPLNDIEDDYYDDDSGYEINPPDNDYRGGVGWIQDEVDKSDDDDSM
nr:hypothetical protein [Tanacetum cinerariifolium]